MKGLRKVINELAWLPPIQMLALACLVGLVFWGFIILLFCMN